MKFYNYKNLLREFAKKKRVVVGISVWLYSSKRMAFKVDFSRYHHLFENDMELKANCRAYKDYHTLQFKDLRGNKFNFDVKKIRIAKVDFVEFEGGDTYENQAH